MNDVALQCRLLWMLTYSAVIAADKQSVELAVMQANEAVMRYREAWGIPKPEGAN